MVINRLQLDVYLRRLQIKSTRSRLVKNRLIYQSTKAVSELIHNITATSVSSLQDSQEAAYSGWRYLLVGV